MAYSLSIEQLIKQFSRLPGIGYKTAERLVIFLLDQPKEKFEEFITAQNQALSKAKKCGSCFNYSENDSCPICADSRRDKKIICVVAKPQDIIALEKTHAFPGVYYVLGAVMSPLNGDGPEKLKIQALLEKIKNNQAAEIILALNPDMDGETTSLYLIKLLKQFPGLKISRLARGLPMGADLEYADEITLENALKGRQRL